ncbi:15978_t:CDS:2 [Cetraspora pellucida]|uniref:15978_t:CDS:1 n=1 Tax=Cetraspora pellucida TaxID=1433469 RepID=A0A9N9K6H1_9GLOM|nr:15978_t:CDS:2 [Cetraspora pellucida]
MGAHQVHQVSYGNSQEHISVYPTISAARMYISLLIIYKEKCMIPGLLNSAPVGSVMGFTDIGYMKKCLFQKYIKHFIHSIPPNRSVLLILDSHKSHVSYACVSLCYNNNIFLYALLPHTTHILQPAELSFTYLKQAYAYIKTYLPMAICNSFKATGIWPFNPNAISPNHLDPSLATKQFDTSSMQPSLQPSIQLHLYNLLLHLHKLLLT